MPAAADASSLPTITKQRLLELRVQRDSLDSEAQAIISELTAPQTSLLDGVSTVAPMGIDAPLVDAHGYPRGDIDLYRARTLRKRLREIKTDRTSLQADMERLLERLTMLQQPVAKQLDLQAEQDARLAPKPKPTYDPKSGRWVVTTWNGTIAGGGGDDDVKQEATGDMTTSSTTTTAATEPTPEATTQQQRLQRVSLDDSHSHHIPFARIDSVAEHSPAESAGLLARDMIVSFDGLVKESAATDLSWLMQQVGSRVAHAAASNETLVVVVRRAPAGGDSLQSQTVLQELQLRPRPWAGRGLLGCHLVPV